MPLTLLPPALPRDDALLRRMDGIGARLRRVVMARAGAWLIGLSLLFLGGLALLDYRFQLPGLVRALGLAAYLTALPILLNRWIRRPLAGSDDRVGMALRVERAYPEFNDSLSSAVQFLEQSPRERPTSAQLRKALIRRAARKAERYDFERAVDARGTKRSLAAALVLLAGSVWLVGMNPSAARSAFWRLAAPFGATTVPTQTRLEILAPQPLPHRMARGEPLDLRLRLHGTIPQRVTVSIKLDGAPSVDQAYAVDADPESPQRTELTARVEPTRIPRDFQFRVVANDADSGWQTVQVAPPPLLVPLDGRPSPQTRLDFPEYTDLPPAELPDGSSVIDCVAGTQVTIRAATDRPVARAWIGFRPELPAWRWLPALAALGAGNELAAAGLDRLGGTVWQDVPVVLDRGGTTMRVSFVPRLPGPYALRFEDATGLGGTRMFDVRLQPDPAPAVTLERPSPARDSLLVLPTAEVTFAAKIQDRQYALRAVRLEYWTNRTAELRSVPWFEAEAAGIALPAVAGFMGGRVPAPSEPALRLRPQQLELGDRLALTRFRHADGSAVAPGDVIIVRVAAEDFDNVTGFKRPGYSHEVELIVVTRQDLEAVEQQAQSDIRGELLRLHALQREARTRTQQALQQARTAGHLRPEDLDALQRAEQAQQQIRGRINDPDGGLRAQLERMRQAAKDNALARSAATSRLDDAAAELARLANEEFEPLEADLAAARRPPEQKASPVPPLQRAEKRQKEVEQTMLSLLERLEPWSGAGEVRGEARSVLNELKRRLDGRDRPGERVPPDTAPEQLTPEQKAEIERAATGDDRLAERGRQLMEKVGRLMSEKESAARAKSEWAERTESDAAAKRQQAAREPAGSDERKALTRQADEMAADAKEARVAAAEIQREADALRSAAAAGNAEQVKAQLREAAQSTRQNQPGRATAAQRAAAGNLERMLAALEEQRTEDNDRMTKKLKDADHELADLIDQQERLQKKADDAQALKDPAERQSALEKLAREQEKLEAQARDLAQKLSRQQGDRAGDELRRAAREMAQAREQLENGEPPGEKMDDALDRLDEAQRELDQARQKNDEELLREQAARFADDLKALRDREQRLLDESLRLHTLVQKAGKWDRPVRTSLNDLREQQGALAGEVRGLVDKKFADTAVFGRMLQQAADAMDLAAKRLAARLDSAETAPFDLELENLADAGIQAQQRLALKRFDQLLAALKPDKNEGGPMPAGGMGGEPPMPPMGGQPPGAQMPPLAQLKALRELQADIAERTAAFDKAHPERDKLNDDEIMELELLQKMQVDVADLIKQLTQETMKQ